MSFTRELELEAHYEAFHGIKDGLPVRLTMSAELQREHIAEIFELRLPQRCARASGIRREVLSFLATAVGRATAALLGFNEPDRIELRTTLTRAGRYP